MSTILSIPTDTKGIYLVDHLLAISYRQIISNPHRLPNHGTQLRRNRLPHHCMYVCTMISIPNQKRANILSTTIKSLRLSNNQFIPRGSDARLVRHILAHPFRSPDHSRPRRATCRQTRMLFELP